MCKSNFVYDKAVEDDLFSMQHFESSEKHEKNLKHLPPYRRAVQHVSVLLTIYQQMIECLQSLFTGRLLNEFIELEKVNYYRNRVNAYRIPPSIKSLKNAYYCTFCKKSFESTYSLEKVKHRSIKIISVSSVSFIIASWLEKSSRYIAKTSTK